MVTSIVMKKQRFPMSSCLIGFDIFIFPFILTLIFLSSLISAPILPVFTLPLFLISFPRPMQFWPNITKSEIETNDTIYYQQLMSQFIKSLQKQCPIVSCCRAGTFLLARFDDRLVWIQILESGFNYVKIQVKGLELQETSCHAVEATTIDEMIDETFYTNNDTKSSPIFNSYFWFTIQPLDTLIVKTYSDARNVLTGVIDSPDTSVTIKTLFCRVFVWVLLKHRLNNQTNNNRISRTQESVVLDIEKQVENISNTNVNPNPETKSMLYYDVLKTRAQTTTTSAITSTTNGQYLPQSIETNNNDVLSKWSDDEDDVLGTEDNPRLMSSSHTKQVLANTSATSNKRELKNNLNEPINTEIPDKDSEQQQQQNEQQINSNQIIHDSEVVMNSKESFFNTFDNNNSENKGYNRAVDSSGDISQYELESDGKLMDDLLYDRLMPTNQWLSSALDYIYRKRTNQSIKQLMFSDDWFKSILKYILDGEQSCESAQQLTDSQISSLMSSYKQICLVCFSCLYPINSMYKTNEMTAQTIYQIFNGNIPDDGYNKEFLDPNTDLNDIIVKSFQYTVKIAMDQILMGEQMATLNELIDVLIDYDMNWFIGDETSAQWRDSLISEKPNLFSMGRDGIKECFTSHLLTLQEIGVHLCSMNRAVIEAIWSSLSLELLYLTNDDDERFSIQANPVILRNLTVQAANAPIGYPVFVSQPIVINHLT